MAALGALLLLAGAVPAAQGQALDGIHVLAPGDREEAGSVERHRGYAAATVSVLEAVGFRVEEVDGGVDLHLPGGEVVEARAGTPFLQWDGSPVQLAHPPYRFGGELYLPLQFFSELVSDRRPDLFEWEWDRGRLTVTADPVVAEESVVVEPGSGDEPRGPSRVVVIDPGHGGEESGATGPSGVREKDVALAVSRALARELSTEPGVEVHLTRDQDVHVPLWRRGEKATEWKGTRPGVFVSIHANSSLGRPEASGFETYFLSEARTEHERRVAAVENAPLHLDPREEGPFLRDPAVDGLLRDLRNLDHQYWSSILARRVQNELARVHPGPDRGVKQGPFAVITNALMPAVLVELGFLTNPDEERLLASPEFHEEAARALGHAILGFLNEYPASAGAVEDRR